MMEKVAFVPTRTVWETGCCRMTTADKRSPRSGDAKPVAPVVRKTV